MTLAVDFASDPICGRLSDEHGTWSFCGWLELAAAIQSAIDAGEVEEN
jgi:hypothetical protein